jgi:hypothetical protein
VISDNEIQQAIEAAVAATERDITEAGQVILEVLTTSPTALERDFHEALLARRGVVIDTSGRSAVTIVNGQFQNPVENEPVVLNVRLLTAIREALARASADGVIVTVEGTIYGERPLSINVDQHFGNSSSGGSIQVPTRSPVFGVDGSNARWRLLRDTSHTTVLLAREDLASSFADLLGLRGQEVLQEALACFRRGRYLAATDLLAAASEAAWFTIASHVVDDDKLSAAVTRGDSAATVISKTADAILRARALNAQVLNDVRAQAAHLRDLRNYGVHPVGDPDAHREDAFTEAGCSILFMRAGRYFKMLDDARLALVSS